MNYFPKYFLNKSVLLYFLALLAVTFMYFSHAMDAVWFFFGIAEVVGFFYFSNSLTKKWAEISPKRFIHKVFYTALGIRIAWVVFSYFFYQSMTGQPFEFGAADAMFYDGIARYGSSLIADGNFFITDELSKYSGGLAFSDFGYPVYLSFIYALTGKSILIARLIKAIWAAWTCVLVYKYATRNFGEPAGRIAAVFCVLMPNLIYYCGLHLKETEMVFLTVAAVERTDFLLRSNKYVFANLYIPILLVMLLFLFRTVLGAAVLFAFISALIFSTSRLLKFSNRVIITAWVIIALSFFMGGKISNEVQDVWARRKTNQKETLEWRADREGGNVFSRYASSAVFAPAIFIIPIPTMVSIEWQQNQQLLHGGNFVKEIMAFFLLFAFLMILNDGKWRDFTMPGVFTLSYLMVIAFSAFAQSERFHLPIIPFYLMFAAYGVTRVTKSTKNYFIWYMIILFAIIMAWNWFKLAGRGMA